MEQHPSRFIRVEPKKNENGEDEKVQPWEIELPPENQLAACERIFTAAVEGARISAPNLKPDDLGLDAYVALRRIIAGKRDPGLHL